MFELFHGVNVNDIRGKRVPDIADAICKEASATIPVVAPQFKFPTMISSSSFVQLEHVPIVDVVNPTKDFENLDELAT